MINAKIFIDGKPVECKETVEIRVLVGPVHGIVDESTLELKFDAKQLHLNLAEVTDRCTGSDCEVTLGGDFYFDELVDLLLR